MIREKTTHCKRTQNTSDAWVAHCGRRLVSAKHTPVARADDATCMRCRRAGRADEAAAHQVRIWDLQAKADAGIKEFKIDVSYADQTWTATIHELPSCTANGRTLTAALEKLVEVKGFVEGGG